MPGKHDKPQRLRFVFRAVREIRRSHYPRAYAARV